MKRNTVLWIDDDSLFLIHLKSTIQHLEQEYNLPDHLHLNFYLESNVQNALDMLREDAQREQPLIGLVVLDENMPEMNGSDLAQLIRQDPALKYYRFAMCSGDVGMPFVLQSLAAGSMLFLSKEIPMEQLYSQVMHLVQHVNLHEGVVHKARQRFLRAMAAGLVAAHGNRPTAEVYENMNHHVQCGYNGTIEEYSEALIEHHDAKCNLLSTGIGGRS